MMLKLCLLLIKCKWTGLFDTVVSPFCSSSGHVRHVSLLIEKRVQSLGRPWQDIMAITHHSLAWSMGASL